jgi:NADPH-dependent 2,4-dienoyl-CoA reductase/sulfur reductase-like enzyme
MMEEIIASGQADVVEIGRATVADPFFVKKIKIGRENEIRKCTRCYQCLAERVHTQTRICAINPVIGRELENLQAFPPTDPKKILVAGGGPGGLQAAVKAAERGHDVTLYEKSDSLGGALKSERKVDFKADFFGLAQTLKAEADRVGVKILLNTELTSEIAKAEKADIVIAAVGAEAIMPPLPGIDSPNVISANRLSDDDIIVGNKVVILGGGLVGCEAAIHLAQDGKDVTIVELLDGIARDLNGLQAPVMLHKMDDVGIKVLVSTKGLEINDIGLKIEVADGTQSVLEADTIFIAVGQRPKVEAVDKLRDAAPIVEVVGDCFQPGKITDALVRGWYAGIDA